MTKESKFADILRNRPDSGEQRGESPAGKAVRGKRGNPEYAQVTAYISRKLHEETKINLIRQGNREFSELVAELLAEWNWKQTGSEKHDKFTKHKETLD